MYRSILGVLFVVMAFSSLAIEQFTVPEDSALGRKRAKLRERIGPIISQPNSQRGQVALIDLQTTIPTTNFVALAKAMSIKTRYGFTCVSGSIDSFSLDSISSLLDKYPAQVRVFIVDNPTTPAVVTAPDDHWAIVNVNKLARGLANEDAKNRFLAPRVRKQCLRAIALLAGVNSRFENNLCSATNLIELDAAGESLPMDVLQNLTKYLDNAGLSPKVYKSYRAACREGWAPAPTNDIQKAIWNEIHTPPTDPLRITFDPKTDTK